LEQAVVVVKLTVPLPERLAVTLVLLLEHKLLLPSLVMVVAEGVGELRTMWEEQGALLLAEV
jgi:hypothetical protein